MKGLSGSTGYIPAVCSGARTKQGYPPYGTLPYTYDDDGVAVVSYCWFNDTEYEVSTDLLYCTLTILPNSVHGEKAKVRYSYALVTFH